VSHEPWREIAIPYRDVLQGTFKLSEFATDVSLAVRETATSDYQDAEHFFDRM